MATSVSQKRARFRDLHREGCFVIPNPWDVGSARRLENMGFEALASTSSGAAWALGLEDGQLSRDQVLAHLRQLVSATRLPVNADFEFGFSKDLDGLAKNVGLAIDCGIAGLSLEDYDGLQVMGRSEAAERIRVAHDAIVNSGQDVLLIGRAENYLRERADLHDTIERLVAYSEAGADCLYAPGVMELPAIREIVRAVAPKPVNALLNRPGVRVSDLAAAGVRRVSVGGALARAAWAGFESAANSLLKNEVFPDLSRLTFGDRAGA